ASRISSARSSTRRVHGSMPAHFPARRRAMSLVLSWALMARCTRSTSRNARSMAAAAPEPRWRIYTSVPSSGRARLALSQVAFIHRENAFHAIGHVAAGKRGAADVADVAVEDQRIVRRLAGELQAPLRIADLAAVRLAVGEDLD